MLLCCVLLAGGAASAQKASLRIAAASDLQPVMPALAAAFEHETGIRIEASFGSSSVLATQIVNGAPVDVFLGADFSFPETVVAAELADEREPFPYALGTLVLWSRKDSPLQPITVDTLTDPRITRIAVADEFHAPYGRAAYAELRALKLLERVQAKLVHAENIAQAAQFVESGNAQAGFVSLTLANSEGLRKTGSFVRVPKLYPEIRQCGVVLKRSGRLGEARRFREWLVSPSVQAKLHDLGLDPVR